MNPPQLRRRLLLGGIMLAMLVVCLRAFALQVLDSERWQARAEDQQVRQTEIPAPRGTIYDRDGIPLAASHEAFRINIAPREIDNRDRIIQLLQKSAGISKPDARRFTDPKRTWVVVPGRYNAATREALDGLRGVYFDRVQQRFYPRGAVALEVLGLVNAEGQALGGLELEFDTVLNGRPGRATVRRNPRTGGAIPGLMREIVAPQPGYDIYLTIDADLQEIAYEALKHAVEETKAAGGTLVLSDPRTGEILAAVSTNASAQSWRAATEPYEPGSTLKPFAVATLLATRKASLSDSVFAENGVYVHDGRTLHDVHAAGWLTLGDALKQSSNIAMAKMIERVEPAVQFDYLRAFGFGTPTAIAYPSETGGLLRRPAQWSKYSPASLAIGYEIAVTPLQMLMAYGALANGGVLMEPRLVREVRSPDGRTVQRHDARAVRRVIPKQIAEELRPVLVDVVRDGSGRAAGMGPFDVAGKTGTARVAVGGQYRAGAYTSSFAGFFPADDPQLVFLVKLDSPKGSYYGGATAAPVTRATLEAALAAINTPLDKRAVASAAPPRLESAPIMTVRPGAPAGPVIFAMESGLPRRYIMDDVEPTLVPDVAGLPMRDAVLRLHAAGYRVRAEGSGTAKGTFPNAGERVAPGTVVRVVGSEVKR